MNNEWMIPAIMLFTFFNVLLVALIIYKRFSGPEPKEKKN